MENNKDGHNDIKTLQPYLNALGSEQGRAKYQELYFFLFHRLALLSPNICFRCQ